MLLLCLLGYALQIALGESAVLAAGALHGPDVLAGQWWRLLTTGFLHGGVLHLGLNMVSLLVLGRGLEALLSRSAGWFFPALYVGSLLGGSLGAMALDFQIPVVGASGAIFGLLGASVIIPHRLGLGWNGFGVMPWLALNLYFTFSSPIISKGAHLGGLLAGLLIGSFMAPRIRRA